MGWRDEFPMVKFGYGPLKFDKSEDITSVSELKIAYQRCYFLHVYHNCFSDMARPYLGE